VPRAGPRAAPARSAWLAWRPLLLTTLLGVDAACTAPRRAAAPASRASDTASAAPVIPKVSRQMVWGPGPGGTQVPLWPDGLAIQKPEADRPEEVGNGSRLVAGRRWHWATYVSRPTMTVYPPKRPRGRRPRAAVVVLPGGGYEALAMDLEGTEVCDWVTARGLTCVLLKYRVPQAWRRGPDRVEAAPAVQLPLQDAQRAVGLLRHRAAAYGIDPRRVGVIGFSAGGHLAAAVSNAAGRTYAPVDAADREPSRPDFAVLLYPGHLWDETRGRSSLALAPWVVVGPGAPPTLLVHATDDRTDDVRHSVAYGLALRDAGAPVELHLYATGGHAFGLRPTSAPVTTDWPKLAERWLRTIGVIGQ
jgi:acetyl esterase/lipase